jgi:acryloyl-coenzyme A reductase
MLAHAGTYQHILPLCLTPSPPFLHCRQPHLRQTLQTLAPGGRLVTVGNLETGIVDLNPGLVIVKELEILGAYATTQSELHEALRLVETGALRSWVSDVLPLHEAAQAHDRLEKKEVAGRLVLEPVH